ncbi:MAG TPA: hypothetical protein VFO19_01830, partial [Vicinamibacterales bacterium]|nr:hypothetical protein [Vicinamibacterales bacterium]
MLRPTSRRLLAIGLAAAIASVALDARQARGQATPAPVYVLTPSRVFDGEAVHDGWIVVVRGQRIEGAGPPSEVAVPAGAEAIDLNGQTLLPGLIDAHSHVLLHAYNETAWNDQVLKEAESLRVARAVNHLKAT